MTGGNHRRAAIPARSAALRASLCAATLALCPANAAESMTELHYACGDGIVSNNGLAGFNLADVNSVAQLEALPDGDRGLVWLGLCDGVDAGFVKRVAPFIGHRKVYGFYLMDEPDPTGIYSRKCPVANLAAESDYIHAAIPGAETFIVLMGFGTAEQPSYADTYKPSTTHVDLYGVDPYPCRSEIHGCRFSEIPKAVAAAEQWGIPRDAIVPFFQAFGGGKWRDGAGGRFVLPTPDQARQILATWKLAAPRPAFDAVYAWGSQREDATLESDAALQAVFAEHNARGPAPAAP